jgi:hypothetical protein
MPNKFPPLETPARITEMMQREIDDLRLQNQELRAREQIAKEANDAMRAERDRLQAQVENLLKPQRDQAIARAEAAELLCAELREAATDLLAFVSVWHRSQGQDKAAARWESAIAKTPATMGEEFRRLRALCAELRDVLEGVSNRAPIMGSTGDYREGQLHALEAVREQAAPVLAKAPATMGEEIGRLREENEHLRMEDGLSTFYKQKDEIAALRQQLADVNVSLSRRDDTINALRNQLAERDALRAIFPEILRRLRSGACAPDCSVEFLRHIPDEVGLVADALRARVAELTKWEERARERTQLCNDLLCRAEKAEARNERIVAAGNALAKLLLTPSDLPHEVAAWDAALADNGGATAGDAVHVSDLVAEIDAGKWDEWVSKRATDTADFNGPVITPVSTSSTRPADLSKNGAGIDTGATHRLKTWPPYFIKVESGEKTFEVRLNDRGYKVGDTLILEEWDRIQEHYTGRTLTRTVTYVMEGPGFGLAEGYVVLALDTPHPDSAIVDWLELDMKKLEPVGIEFSNGQFRFPYLVSSAGGFGGGVGEFCSPSLRATVRAAMQAAKEGAS